MELAEVLGLGLELRETVDAQMRLARITRTEMERRTGIARKRVGGWLRGTHDIRVRELEQIVGCLPSPKRATPPTPAPPPPTPPQRPPAPFP
jgi:hypothetical protein